MAVISIGSAEAFSRVKSSPKPVIIDFKASWCGPCQYLGPIFKEMSEKYSDVGFFSVDVDDLSDVAMSEGVSSMPTIIAYQNGRLVQKVVGADPNAIERMIQSL